MRRQIGRRHRCILLDRSPNRRVPRGRRDDRHNVLLRCGSPGSSRTPSMRTLDRTRYRPRERDETTCPGRFWESGRCTSREGWHYVHALLQACNCQTRGETGGPDQTGYSRDTVLAWRSFAVGVVVPEIFAVVRDEEYDGIVCEAPLVEVVEQLPDVMIDLRDHRIIALTYRPQLILGNRSAARWRTPTLGDRW